MSTFYQDDKWQLFDPATGAIKVTDSKEACAAAARPDVDPAYNNYCVECLTSYLDAGATTPTPYRLSRYLRAGLVGESARGESA